MKQAVIDLTTLQDTVDFSATSSSPKLMAMSNTVYYRDAISRLFATAIQQAFIQLDFTDYVYDDSVIAFKFFDSQRRIGFYWGYSSNSASYADRGFVEWDGGWWYSTSFGSYVCANFGRLTSNTSGTATVAGECEVTIFDSGTILIRAKDYAGDWHIIAVITKAISLVDGETYVLYSGAASLVDWTYDSSKRCMKRTYCPTAYTRFVAVDYKGFDDYYGEPIKQSQTGRPISGSVLPTMQLRPDGRTCIHPSVDSYGMFELRDSGLVLSSSAKGIIASAGLFEYDTANHKYVMALDAYTAVAD